MAAIPNDSFTFGTLNSLTEWGIKCIAYDVFSPPKRDRKQKRPFRSGAYDYGEKYYDERIVRLECDTGHGGIPPLDKVGVDEVKYHLSKRDRLFLWDYPGRYYVGELMQSANVEVLPTYVKQRFTLSFICEPFAYSAQTSLPLTGERTQVDYKGTAETPTLFILRNTSEQTVNSVVVTVVKKS